MLIVTTDGLAGYAIRNVLGDVLGTAHGPGGSQPQQPGVPGSSGTFATSGEHVAGGLVGVRRRAVEQLAMDAQRKGANAVTGMRFETVVLPSGAVEICAYGTAVWADVQHGAPPQEQPKQQYHQPPGYPPALPGDHNPAGPPMAARNLTIGLGEHGR